MIDQIIGRIKDAYWQLEGDIERRQRFTVQTQLFTPGAIQMPPSQPPAVPDQGMMQPGMGIPQPAAAPAPAPEPSLLDMIGSRR